MREKLLEITDMMPRWGELSARQRLTASLMAVLVVASVGMGIGWAAGAFRADAPSPPIATGPTIESGLVKCSRAPIDGYSDLTMIGALGDTALPYRVNLADIATSTLDASGQLLVLASVCTDGTLSGDQLKDVGTIVAQQIKAHSDAAARIRTLCIQDIRSGSVANGQKTGQVVTQFLTHPFTLTAGVYRQRSAWTYDLEASE